MAHLAILLLKVYKLFISPMLPASCRFYPTCSEYATEALAAHGLLKGSWLGLKRIARCHPWHPGGYDPIPDCCNCAQPAGQTTDTVKLSGSE